MIRQRDYLRAKANKTGSNILRQAYSHIRNKVNSTLRKLRKNYYTDRIQINEGNLKNTWKVLKEAIGQNDKTCSIDKIVVDDTNQTDKAKIADAFNNHFVSIGEKIANSIEGCNESPTANIQRVLTKFEFQQITTAQITKVVQRLVNGKATGIHNIPNKVLKDSVHLIAPILMDIFNLSISAKIFPEDLKVLKVVPVYKSGERESLNNYRPIAVLPTIARVFEKLLYGQLYSYLMHNKLLDDRQSGFRSLHSTALALGKSTDYWLMNIDNGKLNSVVFLDIRKAFDTVNHEILLQNLECYGIRGNELIFFQSYLENRIQACSVNGHMSSFKSISYGVPQGSILGPLLFIIYMNDLPSCVKEAEITMYADDTSLYKAFRTAQDLSDELIPAFVKICEWLKMNKLALNVLKTEFMIIGTSKRLNILDQTPETTPYITSVDGCQIRRVKSVKYLGLIVDDTLTWAEHVDYISTKIRKNIGIIKRVRTFLPPHSLLTLYRTLIEPYLRYCNTVWGQCSDTLKEKLQCLQNRVARAIAVQRYDEANHRNILNDFEWLNIRHLIDYDLGVLLMYKTVNGHGPEIRKEAFHDVNSTHEHATRSAVKGDLFVPRKTTIIAQQEVSVAGPRLWNMIPSTIRNAQSIDTFKVRLKEHYLNIQKAQE